MSVLSDQKIDALLKTGELVIYPLLDRHQVKGAKADLRLDNVLFLIKRIELESYDAMDLSKPGQKPVDYLERHVIPFDGAFILHPGEFALAPSFESFRIPKKLVGLLDGRSSLGRLGIIVHVTSGSVDPGFSGPLILELANLGRIPVKLFPLMRIASIKFLSVEGDIEHPYKDKYFGIDNILFPGSRLHEDEDLSIISKLHEFF
jgi:dCTP deaminase